MLDARSDLYALGCVLYETLAGEPPFTGPTAQAILARHSIDPVPSLRTVRRTLSFAVEEVIIRALAKVPADRYASAREFREALVRAGREPAASASELTPPADSAPRPRCFSIDHRCRCGSVDPDGE